MESKVSYRFNFKGGIAYVGQLKVILECAMGLGIKEVKSSLRQQLIIQVPEQICEKFEIALKSNNVSYAGSKPNIVSSYVAEDVFQTGNWLTENIYKDIFDSFETDLKLKINISDNSQSFTPFFSGHINFVAATEPNYWHVFLRLPKTNQVKSYDKLIFTNEIANISYALERLIEEKENTDIEMIFSRLEQYIHIIKKKELEFSTFSLPYYEGLNRYGSKTWLGIYNRLETFSIVFLLYIIDLCLQNKVGEICFTPWKSIIIKGITDAYRETWSRLLAIHNINVRHAANELNWQIEDDSEEALALKTELANYFNEIDIRTFGLCFGIKTIPKTEVFASIMVEKISHKALGVLPLVPTYNISYTEDFDPNGRTKVYFAKKVLKINLKEQLRRSVLFYHKSQAQNRLKIADKQPVNLTEKKEVEFKVHQCSICFTVYDSRYGDVSVNIGSGLVFDKLPEEYCCSVCGADKGVFKEVWSSLEHG